MGALLAIAAAIGFGVADVSGAVATRRTSAIVASFGLQLAGFPLLLVGLLVFAGTFSWRAIALGALAGAVGNLGLVLYLRSMAVGPIGVISPISALVGAGVPVGWGVLISGDELSALQLAGVAAGLAAVVLAAWSPGASLRAFGSAGPLVAFVAGILFGLFFVVLDATPPDSGLWPLLGARTAGTLLIAAMLTVVRSRPATRGSRRLMVLSGSADMAANLLFLLATRAGLLSLASLLTSLYPVVAVLLAHYVLHERLTRLQATGVATALAATAALVL